MLLITVKDYSLEAHWRICASQFTFPKYVYACQINLIPPMIVSSTVLSFKDHQITLVGSPSSCNAVVAPFVHFIIRNRMIISGVCALRAVRIIIAIVYFFDPVRLVVALAVYCSGGCLRAHVSNGKVCRQLCCLIYLISRIVF